MPDELMQRYMAEKDPVRNFEEYLLSEGVVTKEDIGEGQGRVEKACNAGYEFAQASPFPESTDVTKGLWVEDGYWTSVPGRGGGTESWWPRRRQTTATPGTGRSPAGSGATTARRRT